MKITEGVKMGAAAVSDERQQGAGLPRDARQSPIEYWLISAIRRAIPPAGRYLDRLPPGYAIGQLNIWFILFVGFGITNQTLWGMPWLAALGVSALRQTMGLGFCLFIVPMFFARLRLPKYLLDFRGYLLFFSLSVGMAFLDKWGFDFLTFAFFRAETAVREQIFAHLTGFQTAGRLAIYFFAITSLFIGTRSRQHEEESRDLQAKRSAAEKSAQALQISLQQTLKERATFELMQREFISMVSHEFRTPITSIQGAHFLLTKKLSSLPKETHEDFVAWLGIQGRALRVLKTLLDQILLLKVTEHVGSSGQRQPILILEQTTRWVDAINEPLVSPRVNLTAVNIPDSFSVAGDIRHLGSAIDNLISNALKYSTGLVAVELALSADFAEWVLTVADCGRGIPSEDQGKLFETFHRASNVGNVHGTGLGLAIVKRVVDSYGGRIEIKSVLNVGTTVTLRFPVEAP